MSEATFKPLRVLITNNTLGNRAGSELYVRDLALALLRRGHLPVAYSSQLGDVAEELRRATIPVIDDLNALNIPPDVIHGQHHLDATTAMLHFPASRHCTSATAGCPGRKFPLCCLPSGGTWPWTTCAWSVC
ncbi:glycosyltransferase family 4 protein [Pseudomonas denitrificans (nom. rej.)]|uniref:Glycosyltransferase family 4 protein n=1 Tax=Pseudomonas denitrificans TaxID=43306 RepID=A0A9X7N2B0_PSEDE|nr:glycosyltransferase family 4 protein [Pseudomonas denitrificans (nom. rej.)]QEY73376.1 glycosyltransferase family 4 protein [Pseudomonas denitrificans (nom. rej.)]